MSGSPFTVSSWPVCQSCYEYSYWKAVCRTETNHQFYIHSFRVLCSNHVHQEKSDPIDQVIYFLPGFLRDNKTRLITRAARFTLPVNRGFMFAHPSPSQIFVMFLRNKMLFSKTFATTKIILFSSPYKNALGRAIEYWNIWIWGHVYSRVLFRTQTQDVKKLVTASGCGKC